jgi:hypothetical protein
MINNKLRVGNFTSSEIVALTTLAKDGKSFGKPALTYIEETNMERRLGRSLTDETNARPLTWGKLLEGHVFNLLGLEYSLTSTDTIQHPEIPFWTGSPDGEKKDTVIDIKCPMTLKSFCQLVDCKTIDEVRENHKDGEKFYWQLVSNAVLKNKPFAELIPYMPYFSELADIRMLAQQVPGDQLSKHYWIAMACDDELPYLVDGGYYKNVNVIRFEVPNSDKALLKSKVLKAGEMLIPVDGEPAKNLVAETSPAGANDLIP